ncbi:MAG: dephospho-CoA kinase [Alphaproteobacteria bacterium]|nr:dephospho-CoA kinase [Alphaproteobacteria bacterium]
MIVLGLTGSIGMGKSAAATVLRQLGVPVHDADQAVHRLLGPGGSAVPRIAELFPQAIVSADGGVRVDRRALGAVVFGRPDLLKRLEAILHPLVRRSEQTFIRAHRSRRVGTVAIDVPLLFETGTEKRCDAAILVTAPAAVQAHRVLARPGMTSERFAAVRKLQMPERDKRRRADFVVMTGLSKRLTRDRLTAIVRLMATPAGRARVRDARNRRRYRNNRA